MKRFWFPFTSTISPIALGTAPPVRTLPLALTKEMVSLPAVTWPGQLLNLHFSRTTPRRSNFICASTRDQRRIFSVKVTLCRPGFAPQSDRYISFEKKGGDSHLKIANAGQALPAQGGNVILRAHGDAGNMAFHGYANDLGYLAELVSDPSPFHSFEEAEETVIATASAMLSNLSAQYDIPLQISQVQTECLNSGKIRLTYTMPHWQMLLRLGEAVDFAKDLNLCAGLYREAMNSSSPIYAFLCLYKITDAIESLRTKAKRKAKSAGLTYQDHVEQLPLARSEAFAWLSELFYVNDVDWERDFALFLTPHGVTWGQSFHNIKMDYLRPIRNTIAHFLNNDLPDPLNPDDAKQIALIRRALPLLKVMARRMMKSSFPDHFVVKTTSATHIPQAE